jgi:hypothetical protein
MRRVHLLPFFLEIRHQLRQAHLTRLKCKWSRLFTLLEQTHPITYMYLHSPFTVSPRPLTVMPAETTLQ